MSSLRRTIERNKIKRLAGLYRSIQNRKVKKKEGKPIDLKFNRFDFRLLLKKAFKSHVTLLKVGDKVAIKDNRPDKKSA